MAPDRAGPGVAVDNVLVRYRDLISAAGDRLQAHMSSAGGLSCPEPAFVPPRTDRPWPEYFSVSGITIRRVAPLGITVLDMTQNPGTRTTKTIGSLLIVARAVSHHERTGERIALLTPSSGNKATALRDAVSRAYRLSLATTDTLRMISVVPSASAYKVRHCDIADDAEESRCNPVLVRDCEPAHQVREEVQSVMREVAGTMRGRHGWRLWNTSAADNYAHGDCVRAFLEDEFLPVRSTARWHVHAVSSGFGLLGYNLGYQTIAAPKSPHAAFLLVQHLAAAGLVLSLSSGEGSDVGDPPPYEQRDGVFSQATDPRFPPTATDVREVIDPTFYARRPSTIDAVRKVIRHHGGDGIVVSRSECVSHYADIRESLVSAGLPVPLEPGDLREWSTIMAMTGLLLARERGLLPGDADVVLHATGSYSDATLRPAEPRSLLPVGGAALAKEIDRALED